MDKQVNGAPGFWPQTGAVAADPQRDGNAVEGLPSRRRFKGKVQREAELSSLWHICRVDYVVELRQ